VSSISALHLPSDTVTYLFTAGDGCFGAFARAGAAARSISARECHTGAHCGFALAAIHRDSSLWRHHQWVKVEALHMEEEWRGRALALIVILAHPRTDDRTGN
jgi:hypothetical protein